MTVNSAQQYHQNVVHVLRKPITYLNDGETISLGWLPAGAIVVGGGVMVSTAFDGDTTNTVDVGFRNAADGTAVDTNDWGSALALGTAGWVEIDETASADLYTAEGCEAVAVVTSTASATAGAGVVVVNYVVDNS